MRWNFEAQIITGKLKIYGENKVGSPLYTVTVETEDKEHFKMKVADRDGKVLGEVAYKEDIEHKFMMVINYTINNFETGEQIAVKVERGKKLYIDESKNIYLIRSMRDRKMLLYKDDKLIMALKCKTFLRNWLRGDYTAEILDESYAFLCICVISMILNIIFDEHNCTSFM